MIGQREIMIIVYPDSRWASMFHLRHAAADGNFQCPLFVCVSSQLAYCYCYVMPEIDSSSLRYFSLRLPNCTNPIAVIVEKQNKTNANAASSVCSIVVSMEIHWRTSTTKQDTTNTNHNHIHNNKEDVSENGKYSAVIPIIQWLKKNRSANKLV